MAIGYYIFKAIAWIISKLPFPLLYILSDCLYIFLFYIIGYRKKVVITNLNNAFPDNPKRNIKKIAGQYYRNLADVILEIIKLRSITSDQLLKRFSFDNILVFRNLFKANKSIILSIGHCGNWEWMGAALTLITEQKGYAIVKPLSDPHFDRYLTMLRTRLNKGSLIPFKETYRTLVKNKNRLTFNVFAADQTPTRNEINYWKTFLNQDTPFFTGIDKIARSLDMGVLFIDIQRVKRGQYKGVITKITDDAKNTKEDEITKKYITLLEQSIRNRPDNWLWSHRRWKHKKKENSIQPNHN